VKKAKVKKLLSFNQPSLQHIVYTT